jgi:fatty-acid desaturase
VRGETGANAALLVLAIVSTVVVLVTFAFTTLVDEPATIVALAVILVLSIGLDLVWKRARSHRSIDLRRSSDAGARSVPPGT